MMNQMVSTHTILGRRQSNPKNAGLLCYFHMTTENIISKDMFCIACTLLPKTLTVATTYASTKSITPENPTAWRAVDWGTA